MDVTDLDRLSALLTEWEVPHTIIEHPNLHRRPDTIFMLSVDQYHGPDPFLGEIAHIDGDFDKVTGYSGFCTDFEFDAEKRFLRIGAWE